MEPRRRRHSLATASLAGELGVRYGYGDAGALARAALLHDVGRSLDEAEGVRAAAAYGWPADELEQTGGMGLIHGPAGAAIASAVIEKELAASIRYHVTGRPGATVADKIIMAADAAEPTRAYPWAPTARLALATSLDVAVAFWLTLKTDSVRAAGRQVHPRALAALADVDAAVLAEAERLAVPFRGG
jgi:HD superfamily phosphohydrolase YqeK